MDYVITDDVRNDSSDIEKPNKNDEQRNTGRDEE